MTILITGTSGFVGTELLASARSRGMCVRSVLREDVKCIEVLDVDTVIVPTLLDDTDWKEALSDIDVVIHCAARVHVMHDDEADPLTAFRSVNVEGTLNLARQAAMAGVRRFVFLSSIKVNGEGTRSEYKYSADDLPAPVEPYAISKAEAESELRMLAMETGMEVVIIRPPLVYGPRVKGNFHSLVHCMARSLPLPLGAVTTNRRSLVALDNLIDLILLCVDHPSAANQTFLVSDGDDLSTTELLKRVGKAMNRPVRLVPIPPGMLTLGATLLGKKEVAQRLLGSLQVDIRKTRELLNWTPPVSVDEGLRKMVEWNL